MQTGASPDRIVTAAAVIAGVAVVPLVVVLARLEIDPTIAADVGRANLRALVPFWIAVLVAWVGLTGLAITLRRASPSSRRRFLVSSVAIVAVAAALRIVVVATHVPSLSDDVHRYVFDGRNLAAGRNPYLVRPADRVDAETERWPGERALAARVNNPELHTIYLPASQWFFGAVARIAPADTHDAAAATRPIRLALSLCDLGAVVVLLLLLRDAGRSPWWAALYAWHPLAISEIAASGHQESLGILLLLLGTWLATRRPRSAAAWGAAMAGSCLVKPVAAAVPLLALRGAPARRWLLAAAGALLVTAVVAAPLLLSHGAAPLAHLWATASRFTLKWAHFGPVYDPLLWSIEHLVPGTTNDVQERMARLVCAAVLLAVIGRTFARGGGLAASARAVLFAMVVLSPAAHPWYLLWALAFVPLAPSVTTWVASPLILLAHAAWAYRVNEVGDVVWGARPWAWIACWGLVALTALVVRWRHWTVDRGQGTVDSAHDDDAIAHRGS